MQKGFSLIEMLMVSLLGSFLLLAASQVLTTLIKYQTDQSELLRLAENTALAEIALRNGISKLPFSLSDNDDLKVCAGVATDIYPNIIEHSKNLTCLGKKLFFNQFSSSDWLFLPTYDQNKEITHSLFHLDKKSYGYGLAYKPFASEKEKYSQTLVNQVELVRFRYLQCDEQQDWIRNSETLEIGNVCGIQFALILASNRPVKKRQKNLILWGEILNPPSDGLYRQLISSTVRLTGIANDKP